MHMGRYSKVDRPASADVWRGVLNALQPMRAIDVAIAVVNRAFAVFCPVIGLLSAYRTGLFCHLGKKWTRHEDE